MNVNDARKLFDLNKIMTKDPWTYQSEIEQNAAGRLYERHTFELGHGKYITTNDEKVAEFIMLARRFANVLEFAPKKEVSQPSVES